MSELYPNGNVSHVYQGNAYPQQPPTSQYQVHLSVFPTF